MAHCRSCQTQGSTSCTSWWPTAIESLACSTSAHKTVFRPHRGLYWYTHDLIGPCTDITIENLYPHRRKQLWLPSIPFFVVAYSAKEMSKKGVTTRASSTLMTSARLLFTFMYGCGIPEATTRSTIKTTNSDIYSVIDPTHNWTLIPPLFGFQFYCRNCLSGDPLQFSLMKFWNVIGWLLGKRRNVRKWRRQEKNRRKQARICLTHDFLLTEIQRYKVPKIKSSNKLQSFTNVQLKIAHAQIHKSKSWIKAGKIGQPCQL